MDDFISSLVFLYNYGEAKVDSFSTNYKGWLQKQNWLFKKEDYFLISDRWIELCYLTNDQKDFIKHLFIFLPQYQKCLLVEILRIGLEIGKSEDQKGLMKYINSLPKFAPEVLHLYQKLNSEFYRDLIDLNKTDWKEIKKRYNNEITDQLDQYVFGGKIDYNKLIRMLEVVQQVGDNYNSFDINRLEKLKVSKNWSNNRRLTTNPKLKPVKSSHYTLVPIKNRFDYPKLDIIDYLNNPWGMFLILLGMAEKQLRAEDNDHINIRPDSDDPYQPEAINFFTYLDNGQEVYVSSLEQFIKDFLIERGLKLFPDKELNFTKYFVELLEADIYEYKNQEYTLADKIDSLLYDKPLLYIKNEAKELTNHLKTYVERLAKSYGN